MSKKKAGGITEKDYAIESLKLDQWLAGKKKVFNDNLIEKEHIDAQTKLRTRKYKRENELFLKKAEIEIEKQTALEAAKQTYADK
ncbi:hypothetical protein [Bacteroidetes bacterium endosymbiont of Geopemphigus sp.]|uniref:hypothetical protein n=1 Tax=Bacteroidetes bacterium endosymbiont of Geopemphigus sp. TaxID=2047937 RepID=UPI000CD078E0|nr:hypothetical protein [Bacteroidetes bacterium endosymbiont of Geopemphigus sp.]